MNNSIWSTVECYAWSRNFDYEEYLDMHSKSGTTGEPASAGMYADLCAAFDYELENDNAN